MLMEAKNDIKEEPIEEQSEPSRGSSAHKKDTTRQKELKLKSPQRTESPRIPQQPKKESRTVSYGKMTEYGCIPLELISDLGLEKHWKVKIKALTKIEEIVLV